MADDRHLFAADIHLDAAAAGPSAGAFREFLARVVPGARALFLLGDLFDAYLGPRQLSAGEYPGVIPALGELVTRGTEVVFLPGNRDFLAGPEIGARIEGNEVLVELGRTRALLCHGDLLCTRDRSYHRARRVLRSRPVRLAVRVSPWPVLRAATRALRRHSRQVVERKGSYRTDLAAGAVVAAFRRTGADLLVAGHVHRPRDLVLPVDGRPRRLIGLPPWDQGRAAWLEWSGGRLSRQGAWPDLPESAS